MLDNIDKHDFHTVEEMQAFQQQIGAAQQMQQQKTVPAGYQQDPQHPGQLIPITGGPADPETAAKLAKSKRENLSDVEAKAKVRELAKSAGEVALSDKDAKFLGGQLAAGDKSVITGMGRGNQGAKNIVKVRHAAIEQLMDEGASPAEAATRVAEFEGTKSAERTLGTRTANAGMAVNEAQNMAQLVLDASKKVKRTEFQDLNSLLIASEEKTGSVEAVQYGESINSYINAYARAVSPTGTPTVHDKEHAREVLAKKFSEGQIEGGIAQLDKEMAAAKKSPVQTKQDIRELATGKKESVTSPHVYDDAEKEKRYQEWKKQHGG
jgi:hypothetical protein